MTSSQTGTGVSTDDMKLLNVQVFFRHGARTPLRPLDGVEEVEYDKNILDAPVAHAEVPYEVVNLDTGESMPCISPEEKSFNRPFKGGMYSGMLTAIGKQQMYELGQRLRRRYIEELNFVKKRFNKEEVYVRSSHVNRTIESLRSVVGGMFGVEQFKENGRLIISSRHCQQEDLMPNARNCRTLRQIGENMVSSLLNNTQYRDVMTKVQQATGITDYLDMVVVFDHMTSRKVHGLKVEQWMLDLEKEIAKAAIAGVHFYIAGDKEIWQVTRPLAVGKLYQMIEDNMKAAISGENSVRKLHLYSCHDTSIIPLLMGLGDPVDHWPPYAAEIRYELYEDNNGKHWVRLVFCGQDYVPAGCDESLIEFSKFQDIIKHVKLTPDQYTLMCSDLEAAKEFAKMNR